MRNKWGYLLCISLLLSCWCSAAAYGQSSGYTIERSVLDGGGGQQSAGGYSVYHSIGQASGVAASSSGQYSATAGFLASNVQPLGDAVSAQKESDLQFANYWDTITYTLTVQNLFLEPLYFQIEDLLSDGVEYESGSLWVNDEQIADDAVSGDLLTYQSDAVAAGDALTLSYQATVTDVVSEAIENIATITAFTVLNTPFTPTFLGVTEPVLVQIGVPEPGTLALLGIGLFGVLVGRKRLRNRTKAM